MILFSSAQPPASPIALVRRGGRILSRGYQAGNFLEFLSDSSRSSSSELVRKFLGLSSVLIKPKEGTKASFVQLGHEE